MSMDPNGPQLQPKEDGRLAPSPAEQLMARVDAEINRQLNIFSQVVTAMLHDEREKIYDTLNKHIGDLTARVEQEEAREQYRQSETYKRYIIEEARRLGVKPGELVKKD